MRRVGLFLALTVGTALAALAGAFTLGRLADSDAAFFGGGAAGGMLGILLVGRILVWGRIIPPQRYVAVSGGAVFGLALAVGISFFTAILVVVPVLSFALVGAGAVVSDIEAAHGERQASLQRVA